jgi:ornithine cyclodeaminase/alanine dehydrogenase-like protein (mu-crystallin family)
LKILSANDVANAAPYRDIVEALREGFREPATTPVRHHHDPLPTTTLLLMPAWTAKWTGLKVVTVKTDNPAQGLPTVQGSYLLIDNATGAPACIMDGTELTRRRTAAASALAADYLARPDASTLTIVGAGALAPHFLQAHASVRPIRRVFVYARNPEKTAGLAKILESLGFEAHVTTDVEMAVREADIVSCVTTSTTAIVKGEWLKPGTHVDLAGAFKPTMRETDAAVVGMASVFVDTRDGALAEAGDLIQAQAEGAFNFDDVKGDLFDLAQGRKRGRQSGREITLFKSCGTALEDLATAVMVHLRTSH